MSLSCLIRPINCPYIIKLILFVSSKLCAKHFSTKFICFFEVLFLLRMIFFWPSMHKFLVCASIFSASSDISFTPQKDNYMIVMTKSFHILVLHCRSTVSV